MTPRSYILTLPLPPRELGANYTPATVRRKIYRDRAKRAYRLACRAADICIRRLAQTRLPLVIETAEQAEFAL